MPFAARLRPALTPLSKAPPCSLSMSQPISVDILSDDDGDGVLTPPPTQSKRQKTEPLSSPTIFIIDDDPTPHKFSELDVDSELNTRVGGDGIEQLRAGDKTTGYRHLHFQGVSGLIYLESDNESEDGSGKGKLKQNDPLGIHSDAVQDPELGSRSVRSSYALVSETALSECKNKKERLGDSPLHLSSSEEGTCCDAVRDPELSSRFVRSSYSLVSEVALSDYENRTDRLGDLLDLSSSEEGVCQVSGRHDVGINKLVPSEICLKQTSTSSDRQKGADEGNRKKRNTKEDKELLKEQKKKLREQEKLQREALKAEAAELKKLEKEKYKWGKWKFALKSIVAEIDTKVVELGSVAGQLITRFSEKGLTYRITSNLLERSIVWSMVVPDEISQLSSSCTISYILFIFEAEEFCNLVMSEALMEHVCTVRRRYPSHTICYLTYHLMSFINKREQEGYKNPDNCSSWRRPPVEEVLSKLTTHFSSVHSRMCNDEPELAEHVVGLTGSLASCQFRKKLTRLSVNANGSLLPKDCSDRNLIKNNLWLKVLVAIPKVQARYALAIRKKYPTMRSLLNVYMDPDKSVHEKEFLLKDLMTEGLVGGDRKLGEVCSKRVYRILMAQSGSAITDDVENGADFFLVS